MRILIFLALTSSAFAGFSSQRQDDDFVLFFRGIQVFKHTEEFPMLQLANGTFDAIDSQGNFEIDNQVTNMQTFIPEDLGHMGKSIIHQKKMT